MQDPDEVAHGLEEIGAWLRYAEEPKFKSKAYEHAAEVVRTVGEELGPLVEQDRLRELPGIGASLSRQIQELWNTGTSDYLLRLRGAHPEGATELIRIEGLTPRRIRALHTALGIRSVEELLAACAAERVRTVPGFGKKTEERLCKACQRWLGRAEPEAAPPRMLYSHALELAEFLERELLKDVAEVHRAGALRRGEETIDELELVVVGEREPALRRLARLRPVLRVSFDAGIAYLSDGMRLKIHAAQGNLGNVLVLATGSEAHVDALRKLAALRGISLSEAAFANEQALYAALGLAFIPPELRAGSSELEEAAHGGFEDLVRLEDLQGLVHCHTTYSDGKNTVLEMAQAAHALGMAYITITDHSPSAHYAGGVTLDRLKQQWDEIGEAEQRVPIRILRGTESDITSDGLLDYPDAVLEHFDLVIASIHARHRLDRDAMTKRLVTAMSLPVFKIWGHALGRIINHRVPIDCDVPAVLDALEKSRGAVEVNADPHRLDLPPSWIPAARSRGIPFVISVDAHSTNGFGVLRYGVTMARRGGLRKREVLNTLAAEKFSSLVRPV